MNRRQCRLNEETKTNDYSICVLKFVFIYKRLCFAATDEGSAPVTSHHSQKTSTVAQVRQIVSFSGLMDERTSCGESSFPVTDRSSCRTGADRA